MEEQLITFKTSELAKKAGLKVSDFRYLYYMYSTLTQQLETFNGTKWTLYGDYCMAISQSLLQKWLREVHGIDIVAECFWKDKAKKERSYLSSVYAEEGNVECDFKPTYEEALEDALVDALTNLEELKIQ